MERCKNDRTKTYAGTEPSPRGLGLYAGADPVGKTRKGRDGARWTVAQDKNGRKSWRPAQPSRGGAAPALTMRGTLPPITLRRAPAAPQPFAVQGTAVQGTAVQGTAVQGTMRPNANRTQLTRAAQLPHLAQLPQFQEQAGRRAHCVNADALAREMQACMDAMMPLGASGCAATLGGIACIAAMKVLVDSVSPDSAADMERIADKILNVVFDARGLDKPFDVAHGWNEVGNKAARALARKCTGMDSATVTAAGEAMM
jgi:hypothetical protein